MSLLRIHAATPTPSGACQWALLGEDGATREGAGELAQLPRDAHRVELVLAAAQVLIARVRLPAGARRAGSELLAFAVEDQLACEPEANQATWLGRDGDADVLAVIDHTTVQRWRAALAAVGITRFELHCDGFLLPWQEGEWSLAWDGREGVLRSSRLIARGTDLGDATTPPLGVRLQLEQARRDASAPRTLVLYPTADAALPDLACWSQALGIALRDGGCCDWRHAPITAGICLGQQRQRWPLWTGMAARLRLAAAVAATALAIHAVALLADWRALASEQQALQQRMELRFRNTFPDAVAVVDPALQMQRKLAEARHAAGHADSGDFLPMIEPVALALDGLPAGSLRRISYSQGQLILALSALPVDRVQAMLSRLRQSGLRAETSVSPASAGELIVTVRSS